VAYELQRLVENLSNRLNRSVAVDGPGLHLLAYSPHLGAVDSARTGSILKRSVHPDLVDYVYQRGAGKATDLFTVPACAELGLDIARIGMPVHHQDSLLGFVWMLASDGPVTDEQADAVRRAADTVAVMLHREYLIGELSRGRERELTRDLLTDQAGVRARAAAQLITENLFSAGPAAVLVVALARGGGAPLTDQDRLAIAAGVEFGRSKRTPRQALTLERPDHGVLLLSQDGPKARKSTLELGHAIRERVLAEAADGVECWVGLGGTHADPADLYDSYLHARRAADVARVVGVLGPVVRHGELGVYGLLAELPTRLLADNLHPGVRLLLDRDDGDDALVSTVETFLDNAGEVKRTSDQLHIHRTSLYHRLKRVQAISGLDLSVGDDRLALQLGLKIARLVEPR
jgi:sugar diacid utilization regulator